MKSTNEIYTSALHVINSLITLKMNVANGCTTDYAEMIKTEDRIPAIKSWAEANDKIADIRYYLQGGKFNRSEIHFYANQVAEMFN